MAITNDDIKRFESQRLTDKEDGGGRVTGREVIDGNVNNQVIVDRANGSGGGNTPAYAVRLSR